VRDANDADRLRQVLREGSSVLVVGAGLIGAEVAATGRALGAEIVLIDPLDPPLAAVVGDESAAWLHRMHGRHGVETITTTLDSLRETATGIEARFRGAGADRRFDAVLIGVGVRPRTALAEQAGLDVDHGILVDDRQVSSDPRVLAVGDCARRHGQRRTEHWEAATLDADRAAAAILGQTPPASTPAWFWTDRYDVHVEVVGDFQGRDTETTHVRRGEPDAGPFSVFAVRDDRLIGAVAVNDPRTARAARRLIDHLIVVDVEQLRDPHVDLRKLIRR